MPRFGGGVRLKFETNVEALAAMHAHGVCLRAYPYFVTIKQ